MRPDEDITTRLRQVLRRRFAVVALVASVIGLAVGLALVAAWQHGTADQVKVVQRNSRCNSGDLYACRVVAQHIRTACSPSTLAKVPARQRARERKRCGATLLAAGVSTSHRRTLFTAARKRVVGRRSARRRLRYSTTSSPTQAPRNRKHPVTKHGAGAKPSPPATPPPTSAPTPPPAPPPPPAEPLIRLPGGLPCVPVSQLIGCT